MFQAAHACQKEAVTFNEPPRDLKEMFKCCVTASIIADVKNSENNESENCLQLLLLLCPPSQPTERIAGDKARVIFYSSLLKRNHSSFSFPLHRVLKIENLFTDWPLPKVKDAGLLTDYVGALKNQTVHKTEARDIDPLEMFFPELCANKGCIAQLCLQPRTSKIEETRR